MKEKLCDYLRSKDVEPSLKRYGLDAVNGMALGLFGSLIIGLILKNIGVWTGFDWLQTVGGQAQAATGVAIAVCIAHALRAPLLVLGATACIGHVAMQQGGVVGCFIAVLVAAECGKLIYKTTPIDILVTPVTTLVIGLSVASFSGQYIIWAMAEITSFIEWAVYQQPFLMGVILSVSMGIILTLPISSAAIAISLSLSGLAAGAATVGCCAQMVGFAVMGYRENKFSGLLSIGLGTSMLQMPNIIRNWRIWIPPTLAGAILGPLAILVFQMQNVPSGAGMGTSGLVGQIGTLDAMGYTPQIWGYILLLHFVLPAILSLAFYALLRKKGWIKEGYLKLEL